MFLKGSAPHYIVLKTMSIPSKYIDRLQSLDSAVKKLAKDFVLVWRPKVCALCKILEKIMRT